MWQLIWQLISRLSKEENICFLLTHINRQVKTRVTSLECYM